MTLRTLIEYHQIKTKLVVPLTLQLMPRLQKVHFCIFSQPPGVLPLVDSVSANTMRRRLFMDAFGPW